MGETEGESVMQYMLLPEDNYDNSIYCEGYICNIGGYDMSNDKAQVNKRAFVQCLRGRSKTMDIVSCLYWGL